MQILSINYPKQKDDEDKISLLVSNYDSVMRPEVESERKILKIEVKDLNKKVRHTASYKTQF